MHGLFLGTSGSVLELIFKASTRSKFNFYKIRTEYYTVIYFILFTLINTLLLYVTFFSVFDVRSDIAFLTIGIPGVVGTVLWGVRRNKETISHNIFHP